MKVINSQNQRIKDLEQQVTDQVESHKEIEGLCKIKDQQLQDLTIQNQIDLEALTTKKSIQIQKIREEMLFQSQQSLQKSELEIDQLTNQNKILLEQLKNYQQSQLLLEKQLLETQQQYQLLNQKVSNDQKINSLQWNYFEQKQPIQQPHLFQNAFESQETLHPIQSVTKLLVKESQTNNQPKIEENNTDDLIEAGNGWEFDQDDLLNDDEGLEISCKIDQQDEILKKDHNNYLNEETKNIQQTQQENVLDTNDNQQRDGQDEFNKEKDQERLQDEEDHLAIWIGEERQEIASDYFNWGNFNVIGTNEAPIIQNGNNNDDDQALEQNPNGWEIDDQGEHEDQVDSQELGNVENYDIFNNENPEEPLLDNQDQYEDLDHNIQTDNQNLRNYFQVLENFQTNQQQISPQRQVYNPFNKHTDSPSPLVDHNRKIDKSPSNQGQGWCQEDIESEVIDDQVLKKPDEEKEDFLVQEGGWDIEEDLDVEVLSNREIRLIQESQVVDRVEPDPISEDRLYKEYQNRIVDLQKSIEEEEQTQSRNQQFENFENLTLLQKRSQEQIINCEEMEEQGWAIQIDEDDNRDVEQPFEESKGEKHQQQENRVQEIIHLEQHNNNNTITENTMIQIGKHFDSFENIEFENNQINIEQPLIHRSEVGKCPPQIEELVEGLVEGRKEISRLQPYIQAAEVEEAVEVGWDCEEAIFEEEEAKNNDTLQAEIAPIINEDNLAAKFEVQEQDNDSITSKTNSDTKLQLIITSDLKAKLDDPHSQFPVQQPLIEDQLEMPINPNVLNMIQRILSQEEQSVCENDFNQNNPSPRLEANYQNDHRLFNVQSEQEWNKGLQSSNYETGYLEEVCHRPDGIDQDALSKSQQQQMDEASSYLQNLEVLETVNISVNEKQPQSIQCEKQQITELGSPKSMHDQQIYDWDVCSKVFVKDESPSLNLKQNEEILTELQFVKKQNDEEENFETNPTNNPGVQYLNQQPEVQINQNCNLLSQVEEKKDNEADNYENMLAQLEAKMYLQYIEAEDEEDQLRSLDNQLQIQNDNNVYNQMNALKQIQQIDQNVKGPDQIENINNVDSDEEVRRLCRLTLYEIQIEVEQILLQLDSNKQETLLSLKQIQVINVQDQQPQTSQNQPSQPEKLEQIQVYHQIIKLSKETTVSETLGLTSDIHESHQSELGDADLIHEDKSQLKIKQDDLVQRSFEQSNNTNQVIPQESQDRVENQMTFEQDEQNKPETLINQNLIVNQNLPEVIIKQLMPSHIMEQNTDGLVTLKNEIVEDDQDIQNQLQCFSEHTCMEPEVQENIVLNSGTDNPLQEQGYMDKRQNQSFNENDGWDLDEDQLELTPQEIFTQPVQPDPEQQIQSENQFNIMHVENQLEPIQIQLKQIVKDSQNIENHKQMDPEEVDIEQTGWEGLDLDIPEFDEN